MGTPEDGCRSMAQPLPALSVMDHSPLHDVHLLPRHEPAPRPRRGEVRRLAHVNAHGGINYIR